MFSSCWGYRWIFQGSYAKIWEKNVNYYKRFMRKSGKLLAIPTPSYGIIDWNSREFNLKKIDILACGGVQTFYRNSPLFVWQLPLFFYFLPICCEIWDDKSNNNFYWNGTEFFFFFWCLLHILPLSGIVMGPKKNWSTLDMKVRPFIRFVFGLNLVNENKEYYPTKPKSPLIHSLFG